MGIFFWVSCYLFPMDITGFLFCAVLTVHGVVEFPIFAGSDILP